MDNQTTSQGTQYVCPHCDQSYAQKFSLAAHILSHDRKSTFYDFTEVGEESVAGTSFDESRGARDQFFEERMPRGTTNDVYSRKDVKNGLEQVMVYSYGNRGKTMYRCKLCGYSGAKQIVVPHMQTHLPRQSRKKYRCDFCGKTYGSKSILWYTHMRIQHFKGSSPDFQCQTCLKTYSTGQSLSYHVKVMHKIPAQFQCDFCEYRGRQKGALQKHIERVHLNFREFECPNCMKAYHSAAALRKHVENTCKILSWTCKECFTLFPNRRILRRHMMLEHGIKLGRIRDERKNIVLKIIPSASHST